MNDALVANPEVYFAATVLLFVVSLFISLVNWIKLKRMKKRYDRLINGNSTSNLEELLIEIQNRMNELNDQNSAISESVRTIRKEMKTRRNRIEVLRYNAFSSRGSDLSFSIAMVNDDQDGVVLTGLHSRDETYMYAKPIERGQSKYLLSPEEQQVINLASQKKED